MQPLNIGLIGFGISGQYFHAPFLITLPGFVLKAIASSQREKIEALYQNIAVKTIDAILHDQTIDAVVISAPTHSHFALVKEALLADKHVVVEKPFVVTATEGEELITLARVKNKVLTVYHNRRWDSDFLTLKDIIDQDLLGQLSHLEMHFDRFRPIIHIDRWREQSLPGSGILYDLGSHLLDQAFCLFGAPEKMVADVSIQRVSGQAVDYFHLILHYGTLRVVLHASNLVAAPQARIIAHGDKGSFIKWGLDPQESQLRQGMLPPHPDFGLDLNKAELTLAQGDKLITKNYPLQRGNYAAFYEHFYDAVIHQQKAPVPAEEALQVIRTLEEMSVD